MSIDPETKIGSAHLIVRDLEAQIKFYQQGLGFCIKKAEANTVRLGSNDADILLLEENPRAERPVRSTGLYHFAVLLPSRQELARSLWRLVDSGYRLDGAADHAVSEALYLSDPEGNGIELYSDRDRSEWPRRDGRLAMYNAALDLDSLLGEAERELARGETAPETRMGHIHLRAANLAESEAFYVDVLGFDLMQHFGGSAAFVSAGGYHHHVAMNIWESLGAAPPLPGSLGLKLFEIVLPNEAALQEVLNRVCEAGVRVDEEKGSWSLQDPAGIGVKLRAAV